MMSLIHILILTGCIIVVNGQYGGRPGRPTHRPPTLPPRCALVRCARPDCPNPTTPRGQCCPVCPPTLPPHCAAMLCLRPDCPNPTTPPGQCCPVCPVQKPGQCPHRPGPGICVSLCTGDSSCSGKQKCCSNGCGHQCMSPVGGGRSCFHEGEMKKDGEKFKDSCNICTCNDGHVSCTEKACGSKPGKCPRRPRGWGLCIDLCTDDSTCLGSRKCCSSGCGHTCQLPVGGGRCDGITCPQLRCANQYKPPGRCCPICRPIGKPDCRKVACTMEYCDNQYTPPGQCCPVCPRNTY